MNYYTKPVHHVYPPIIIEPRSPSFRRNSLNRTSTYDRFLCKGFVPKRGVQYEVIVNLAK